MVVVTKTYTTFGLTGHEVSIEADSSRALPTIEIIGLPDAAIKEAKERLRSACRNTQIELPPRKLIINLAPSDIKKTGTSFDLPIAAALIQLIYDKELEDKDIMRFGEVGLDGSIRGVKGLLPAILSATRKGYTHFVVPEANVYELAYIPAIKLYPVTHLEQVRECIAGSSNLPLFTSDVSRKDLRKKETDACRDFEHIKGHAKIKRALMIAAAGGHNVLMIGAPGSGKTMLSKAIKSILPPLTFDEALEVSQVYSVVGALNQESPLIVSRPFRQVHHTASKVSIVGGGQHLIPGEVSLAHRGILFFDEIAEFPREVLEVLRQPLEDRKITISRANGTVQYPADFMFVATMNPCKCGFYKDRHKTCSCSIHDIKRYQSKISGPLLDRIDMIIEVPRENIEKILDQKSTANSAMLVSDVVNAWENQQSRFASKKISSNAQMSSRHLQKYVPLDQSCKKFLKQAANQLHLSARVVHRVIKLARTIADIANEETLSPHHFAEAIQYRSKSMFMEGG